MNEWVPSCHARELSPPLTHFHTLQGLCSRLAAFFPPLHVLHAHIFPSVNNTALLPPPHPGLANLLFHCPPLPSPATTATFAGLTPALLATCESRARRLCPHHIAGNALASVTRELLIPKVLSSLASHGRKSPSPFRSLHSLTSPVHLNLPLNAVFP